MITLSIITITYNAARLLPKTLDSVLRQTYPAVEHIIVDGASTDETMDIVGRYISDNGQSGGKHSVVAMSERDHGIYDAMNKGLDMSRGDYVCFLNAGDFLPDEHTLENIAECALSSGQLPAVVYGDTDIVDNDYRFLRHRRLSPPQKLTWRSFSNGMLVCHQAFYALGEIARATAYDTRYRFSADVDWCIRVMKEAKARGLPLRNVGRVVACYLEEGQTTRNHRASLKERFSVMRRHYGLLSTVLHHLWFAMRAIIKR